MNDPDDLEGAVRAYAVAGKKGGGGGNPYKDPGPSGWTLVFDTETTTDPGQALRVGAYEVRLGGRMKRSGLFYNPGTVGDGELSLLRGYADSRRLELHDRDGFVERIFLPVVHRRRGLLIGHNLPFDLFRIAVDHEPARGQNPSLRGGFTVAVSRDPKAPHIQVKRTSPGAAFFSLTIPSGDHAEARNRRRGGKVKNHHGYFLDTATLGQALLGGRPSLERLSHELQTETRKSPSDRHGEVLDDRYLDYMRGDVEVTWQCQVTLRERYAALDLDKSPWKIYSEASIGKAHLEKMGVRGWRRAEFPEPLIAAILESYHGGRTECRIRRTPVPGVYVDFMSQYPTAFALQDLWRLVVARRIARRSVEASEVQGLLDSVDVATVLDPAFWKRLGVLVQVAPDRDWLPTRAKYRSRRDPRPSYNVAVSLRSGGAPVWFTLADCVSSALHTGKAPRVVRAIRFEAVGVQPDMEPIDVCGDARYRVDPDCDDLIRRLVEIRTDIRLDQEAAEAAGEESRAALLKGSQGATKATANSIAYGTGIEINVIEHRHLKDVAVHLPDGGSYGVKAERTEKPGSYFNPLLATLVTGAGRLLLAAAMRLVADAGGEYAYCDTDSLFIVATRDGGLVPCRGGAGRLRGGGDRVRALSWQTVDRIVGGFAVLNPYDGVAGEKSILEIEKENFDPDSHEQREIECYAVASKRGARFVRGAGGRPELTGRAGARSRSEHGLGHLLPPTLRPGEGDWMDRWWEHLLCVELGINDERPGWFDQPAVGRITVTSVREERAFREYNRGRTYDEKVKPWSFMAVAHPTATERARPDSPRTLIGPYERDVDRQLGMDWFDRAQTEGSGIRIRVDHPLEIRSGSVAVQTYGDYFDDYRRHPERKLADPDGRPCHPWSLGLLRPRHVRLDALARIGKESNRLAETALPLELDESAVVAYRNPLVCRGCGSTLEGRQRLWCSEACRVRYRRRAPSHSGSGPGRIDGAGRNGNWH